MFHLVSQYKVRSLQDLVSLKDSDRRNMLRFLGEVKYDEVIAVLGSFPHITMETKLQGRDWWLCFILHPVAIPSVLNNLCLNMCFSFHNH